MNIEISSLSQLSDADVLATLRRAAAAEHQATAQLIAVLMEVDARRLYLAEGCPSLFAYCIQVLHLTEDAAYARITAVRAARRFPAILERLLDGTLSLTAARLLAPHLTAANYREILDAARHKSKRDIEHLVARLHPRPDVPAVVRKLPSPKAVVIRPEQQPVGACKEKDSTLELPPLSAALSTPAEVKPLAPERYKIQFTVSCETHDKLRRAQDMLRHSIPNGDPAAIFDKALTVLLKELSKTKHGAAERPKPAHVAASTSRHVPAAVKRAVWQRDGGQCAFVGAQGRCSQTGFLEFHHVVPYAAGGETTTTNLQLRCRMHNAYEADQFFGSAQPPLLRESRDNYDASFTTRSGTSSPDSRCLGSMLQPASLALSRTSSENRFTSAGRK